MSEPTEAAKELLAQAAQDYAANQLSAASGQTKESREFSLLAAQRAANIRFGRPDEPSGK